MDRSRVSTVTQFAALSREQLMQKLEEAEEENQIQGNNLEIIQQSVAQVSEALEVARNEKASLMEKNKKWVKRLDDEMEKNVEEVTKLTSRIHELESMNQDLILNHSTIADPISSRQMQIIEPCSPTGTVRYSNMSKSDLVYLH